MALGAEAFTILAIMEARDQASEIYDKVQRKLGELSGSLKETADVATESGAKIDESFLETASGADALSLATAKVEAAQGRLAAASKEQANAEKALLDAQEQARVAADGDTEAMDRQIAAADKLAASQKETAKATKTLRDAQADQEAISKAQAPAVEAVAAKTESAGSKLGSVAATMGKVGLGVVLAGGLFAKGAANFQASTTVLETSGGETAAQMDTVRKGILNLSSSTGTALKPLVDGMYMIGSAGYTGGQGLSVLKAAAQGAKAENADLGTVSNALTTIMKDYNGTNLSVAQSQAVANQRMDQMIAVVSNGKTTTEDLAGSLSAVLPIASAAGLGFDQIGGAMATMTGQGESAQQSAQNLANAIRSLQNPNAVAVKEMQALGLNSNEISKSLGTKGLTGTIAELTDAITSHMDPASKLLVQGAFKNATSAAQDANAMIAKMPPNLQALAKSYMDGSVTSKQWKADLQALDPVSAHLMTQFASTADKTHQFNDLLASGSPAAQTYNAALSKMMGGATGLNVALMLSGNNADKFHSNVKAVADAAKTAGSNVDGWGEIQKNFNQKLAEAKQSIEATGISIGTALLPAVTSLLQHIMAIIAPIASWISSHQKLTLIIVGAVAGLGLLVGTINLAVKAYKAIETAVSAVSTVVSKVVGLFGGASAAQDAAAASADGAAASMDGLAASEDATAASTEASTVAADANSASWLRSSLAAVGAAAKFLILQGAELAVTLATKAWTAAQWLFNAAMNANPIMLVVTAIAALAAGVIYAYTHFTAFKQIVDDVFNWLKGIVIDVINFVKDHWELIVQIFTGPIGIVATKIYDHWTTIKRWFSDGVHDVEGILSWFGSLPGKFASWLASTAASIGRGVSDGVAWFVGLPGRVASAISGYFSGLAGDFAGWVEGAANSVANKGLAILSWFANLPGKIVSALGDLGSTLWNAGASLIEGLIGGIESMFGKVKDSLGGLVDDIKSWKGPPAKDKILLTGNGQLIIQGLVAGFDKEIPSVQAKLQGLTANIQQTVTPAALPALPAAGPGVGVSGAGAGVHIHNHFEGARIMNERDMDQIVEKIGRAFATRIGPSGGLRVAM